MAKSKILKLKEKTSAGAGVAVWAMALRNAAFDAINEADITEIMRTQVVKAKNGDTRAAAFVLQYLTRQLPSHTKEEAPRVVREHDPDDDDDDEEEEAVQKRIKDTLEGHQLWKPCPYEPSDPRYCKVVDAREKAGLPARHPEDGKGKS